jgi:tetratricopeptide (TPR) repeat protein
MAAGPDVEFYLGNTTPDGEHRYVSVKDKTELYAMPIQQAQRISELVTDPPVEATVEARVKEEKASQPTPARKPSSTPELSESNLAYNDGTALAKQGRYAEAISDFTKAIQLNPDYALAYHDRGWAWWKEASNWSNRDYALEYFQNAVADYTKAIEIGGSYEVVKLDAKAFKASAYRRRGLVNYHLTAFENHGEFQTSLADFKKAIELNPDIAPDLVAPGVGEPHLRQGSPEPNYHCLLH